MLCLVAPRQKIGQAEAGESIQPPPVTKPALGSNTTSKVQVGAEVFLRGVGATYAHPEPARLANGPRVTCTFSVGSSNTPSLASIGIHAPPSICTSAETIDESPVAVSSTVAISVTSF